MELEVEWNQVKTLTLNVASLFLDDLDDPEQNLHPPLYAHVAPRQRETLALWSSNTALLLVENVKPSFFDPALQGLSPIPNPSSAPALSETSAQLNLACAATLRIQAGELRALSLPHAKIHAPSSRFSLPAYTSLPKTSLYPLAS